jgi:hypothetical protein
MLKRKHAHTIDAATPEMQNHRTHHRRMILSATYRQYRPEPLPLLIH